jgi:2-dehydro-3-deoxy-D-arabinonate dehydratase
MHLLRFQTQGTAPRVGVRVGDDIVPVAGYTSMAELLRLDTVRLRSVLEAAAESVQGSSDEETVPVGDVRLLPPLDGRGEVWCAGVTYERSRGARMEESSEQSIYDRVYSADRPELFPKAPAWRVVTDGEPVGIRADSGHDVPEPELAVMVNSHGEIVGYGVCDDVSSRSIEGENPLYIPQAKVFAGGCALAPGVRPAWEIEEPNALGITMTVQRVGSTAFEGSTSTARLARTLPDLVDALCAASDFPDGVVLATGTGIVPEMDFALQEGDLVQIDIEQVGRLANQVVVGKYPFGWLSAEPTERPKLEEAR